jgi:hypothetical protein
MVDLDILKRSLKPTEKPVLKIEAGNEIWDLLPGTKMAAAGGCIFHTLEKYACG